MFNPRITRNLLKVNNLTINIKGLSRTTRIQSIHNGALSSILLPHHIDVVKQERKMLKKLYGLLEVMEATKEQLDLIQDTMTRVDEVFMVVVVGEFNAGKSTFLNSLLGNKFLKEGILPTTDKICILRNFNYTNVEDNVWIKTRNLLLDDVNEINIPVDWLQHIALIDTPGTNAIIERHEQLTQQIVPRADLVLFVTSAERPISESESNFLTKIKKWGKKVIMVVNKIDILPKEEDQREVLEYVSQNAAKILGGLGGVGAGGKEQTVPVFGVSARTALSAKLAVPSGHDPAIGPGARGWNESKVVVHTPTHHIFFVLSVAVKLGILESYLKDILGKEELVSSKLMNVLGVADRVVATSLDTIDGRERSLEGDIQTLLLIDDTLKLFIEDLQKDIKYYEAQLDKLFRELEGRCDSFLTDRVSIFQFNLLLDQKKFLDQFNMEVIVDMNPPIQSLLTDIADVVVKRGKIQAKAILEYIGPRPKRFSKGIMGEIREEGFDGMRYELQEQLRENTSQVLRRLDQRDEAERIRGELTSSLLQTAGVQSVSMAAMGALFSLQMLDVTGILAASGVMAFGFFLIPMRRAAIKKEFSRKLDVLRLQLQQTVSASLNNQIENIREKISHSIGPYSRFVRLEKQKLEGLRKDLTRIREDISNISSTVK